MKFLIAGLGSIGRRHLQNLITLGQKDIVLYRTHRGNLPQDSDLIGFPVETDLNRALDHKPDAVIISNPTALHMQVAVPAAEAGCALFIEKPLAYQLDDLMEFEALLAVKPVKVFMAFQFRFNPGLLAIKQMIEKGVIGRPLSFHCHWGEYLPDFHPWEDYRNNYAARKDLGGGVVLTLCHPLDYLQWLFGDAKELYAMAGRVSDLDLDVEDQAEVLLRFNSALTGNLHLDFYRRYKRHDLEICGSQANLFWDYDSNVVRLRVGNESEKLIDPPAGHQRNHMFLDEMKHFIQIVQQDIEPLCTYEDGKRTLQLAWGILQSGRYHQRVFFD